MVVPALGLLGLLVVVGFGAFGLTSFREGELRAAGVSLLMALAGSLFIAAVAVLPASVQSALAAASAILLAGVMIVFLLPIGRVERGNDVPQTRVDERDIMFARSRLEPGSADFEAYYAMRPENKASDDKTRALPGLMSLDASESHPLVFASTEAAFGLSSQLRDIVDGPVASEQLQVDIETMTTYVKGLVGYLGAHSVGVCALEPYHVYTHIGRGSGEYGAPIQLDHRYAIAFSVEMDRDMVACAPASPTLLESARQYARAADIAVEVGLFIRSLGYPARAHIDGDYRVIAPLVARDAGLGEFGRMGLLMTPTLGPRVRLGVVTTDLPLIPDRPIDEVSVLDFCNICKKCADACPVRAISFDDRQEVDGALRWRINHDTCFRYWNVTGTDCARCMAVCVYSYPDSPMHNGVRWAARRSGAARRAVLGLDHIFYGAVPDPKPVPKWVPAKRVPTK